MNRRLLVHWIFIFVAVLALAAADAYGAPNTLLWQIGKPDGDNKEFALAPKGYMGFKTDGLFVVDAENNLDQSNIWPYVHPGPGDKWGGARPHPFVVLFGLKAAPAAGNCMLRLVLLDTQSRGGITLQAKLNGQVREKTLEPGGSDQSVRGNLSLGKKQAVAFEFPASSLRAGDNRLDLTITQGSWMLYDWLGLETPAGMELTPSSLTRVESIAAPPILLRREGKTVQPITVQIRHFDKPVLATVRADGAVTTQTRLATGLNTIDLALAPVNENTTLTVSVEAGGKRIAAQPAGLRPVRPWTVYILPHSHVDIGFTAPQPEVEKKQVSNIDLGIELARATAGNPEGERFKWNVEVLWAVETYIKKSPENRKKFIDAVKAGWIGLDALYCNILTGLCRPEEMVRLLRFAQTLGPECGVTIDSIMISDVPGLSWGITEVLGHAGVRYVSDGVNFRARIGGARQQWQDKPMWWVSPSGRQKVLFWTPFCGYSGGRRMKADFEAALIGRIGELLDGGYPYDMSYLRWCIGDNGLPDAELPGIVRAWNARHSTPRLVLATTHEAFAALEARWGDKLPTYRGDFTPYWEDGAGSSAHETALNRASAERLAQAETLWALRHPASFPADAFWQAWRSVLLYSEHTWGASVAVRQPDSTMTQAQWKLKQAFALDADRMSDELLRGALSAKSAGKDVPRGVHVLNTASWKRTQIAQVPAAIAGAGDLVRDEAGQLVPSQRLRDGMLVFLARDVPAYGARGYTVHPGKAFSGEDQVYTRGTEMGNGRLTVRVDEKTGAIAELRMTGIAGNLVDASSPAGMNAYFYLVGGNLQDVQRAGRPAIRVGERGPLVATLIVESDAPGCNRLTREIRLVQGGDRVMIRDTVDKKPVRKKEGVHFGFSFNVPGGQVRLETPWAIVRPDADQIPGACKNWFTVQRWVDISNETYGVTWSPVDAPLVEVGTLTANLTGASTNPALWRKETGPTQTIYSWVMNNHWFTNYRAEQEGPVRFEYVIRPHLGGFNAVEATRFGVESAQALVAVAAPRGQAPAPPRLNVQPSEAIVTALKPSDDGAAWILRLYGASDKGVKAQVTFSDPQPAYLTLSDTDERAGEKIRGEVSIPAWDFVTLRAEMVK